MITKSQRKALDKSLATITAGREALYDAIESALDEGATLREIADEVGCTPPTIRNWIGYRTVPYGTKPTVGLFINALR